MKCCSDIVLWITQSAWGTKIHVGHVFDNIMSISWLKRHGVLNFLISNSDFEKCCVILTGVLLVPVPNRTDWGDSCCWTGSGPTAGPWFLSRYWEKPLCSYQFLIALRLTQPYSYNHPATKQSLKHQALSQQEHKRWIWKPSASWMVPGLAI